MNFECTICLEKYEIGDTVCKLPCNHIFHKDCLQDWLHKQMNCPLCRINI